MFDPFEEFRLSNDDLMALLSTHGIFLPEVGGNVVVAPGTNPELAMAAVSPTEVAVMSPTG